MSKKIIGYTVGTTLPKPSLAQTDPKKGDYIKDKEVLDTQFVKLDAQELTEEQKKQARINIGAIGSQVQSDWNQSDESAVDFIKNKPFGDEIVQADIIPESDYFINSSNGVRFKGVFNIPIVGHEYEVTFGDITTTKVATQGALGIRIGEGNDFLVEIINNTTIEVCAPSSAENQTIHIYGDTINTNKLDEKYLEIATEEEVLQMLVDLEFISLVTDEDGSLLTDVDNNILIYQ